MSEIHAIAFITRITIQIELNRNSNNNQPITSRMEIGVAEAHADYIKIDILQ